MSTPSLAVPAAFVGAFALAGIVIALARLIPAGRAAQPELWAIYRSEFVIVGAVLLPAMLGAWVFSLFLVMLAWRGQFEFARLFGFSGWGPVTLFAMAVSAIAVSAPWFGYADSLPALLVFGFAAVFVLGMLVPPRATRMASVGAHVGGLVFPVLCCVAAAVLRLGAEGFAWVVVAYAAVEANDSFALIVGKAFGTRRIFPTLSPAKTFEGLAAGIVGGGAIGIALAHYLLQMPVAVAAAFAAVVLAAGLAGDLATSVLKRRRGTKDFAPVLTRHGGVLDIYDAFLFAAPAALASQFFWNQSLAAIP